MSTFDLFSLFAYYHNKMLGGVNSILHDKDKGTEVINK